MSKYKLNKFIGMISEDEAKEILVFLKDKIGDRLEPKKVKGIGVNKVGVLNSKTYMLWGKFLASKKQMKDGLDDYETFHNWVISLHGYGQKDMFLRCISKDEVSKKTIFFLPKKLSNTIRPDHFNDKGVLQYGSRPDKPLFFARVNGKVTYGFKSHAEAQSFARTAMLSRIHTLAAELKEQLSNEAYEAIMAM